MNKHLFHVVDYVIFGLIILISVGIGVFYAVSGGRQQTTAEFLVGGRKMTFMPVAISLMVSYESSVTLLGLPAEGYVYGLQWMWYAAGAFVAQLVLVITIAPLLHPLKVTSAYEYLEYRYGNKVVRLLCTFFGMLYQIVFMGIVLFGPAVALEAVTGIPLWTSIFVSAFVAVIYTSIGGLMAVIWTDVFQAGVIIMGVLAILIKGTIHVGGPKEVWNIAERGGRINLFNFSPNPTIRHTFWSLLLGSFVRALGLGVNQSTVQRISSTKSVSEAKRMMLVMAPCFSLSLLFALYQGIVTYAYYQDVQCDPLASKQITNPNQLIPFVVMDMFAKFPGMPGLFLASLFSASLSTLSSSLSSLSALLWADVVQPCLGDIPEWKATRSTKISVVVFGTVACGVAFLVAEIGGTLIQIAISLMSAFSGPLSGIFFLGCFFPRSNAKGALMGGVSSLIICVWLSMGMNFSRAIKKTPWLPPASTDHCDVRLNMTQSANFTEIWNVTNVSTESSPNKTGIATDLSEPQGIEVLYTLSYTLLAPVGVAITIVVGLTVSFITGANKPGDVDPRYLVSMPDNLICLPRKFRGFVGSLGSQFLDDKLKKKDTSPNRRNNRDDPEIEKTGLMFMSPARLQEVEVSDVKTNHGGNDSDSNRTSNSKKITLRSVEEDSKSLFLEFNAIQ